MSRIHGHSGRGKRSPTYQSWLCMKGRCQNPNVPYYQRYGGRGIMVCERWQTFENFLDDMGERPPGSSIERIDNNLGYFPGNCKWALIRDQQNNMRSNRHLAFCGLNLTLAEWARKLALHPHTISGRLAQGYTVKQTLRPFKYSSSRKDALERRLNQLNRIVHAAINA